MCTFSHLATLIFLILYLSLPVISYTVTALGDEIRDLESTTETDFASEVSQWTSTSSVSPLYTQCGGTFILGGIGVLQSNQEFQRTYNTLPAHNSVRVLISLWFLDAWTSSNTITLYMQKQSTTYTKAIKVDLSSLTFSSCGNSGADLTNVLTSTQLPHSGTSFQLRIRCNAGINAQGPGYCGLRNVKLLLLQEITSSDTFCGVTNPSGLFTSTNSFGVSDNCDCAGAGGYYNTTLGTCMPCDLACFSCFGPTSNHCNVCSDPSKSLGPTSCYLCDSTCNTCSGPSATQCLSCPAGSFLYPNSSCISGCVSPYTPSSSGGINICTPTCQPGYIYPDGSCVSTCNLITTREDVFDYCKSPCQGTGYLYPNSTCISNCISPYTPSSPRGINTCTPTCQPGYIYPDGSCLPTCNQIQAREDVFDYCKTPCPGTSYLYPNSTCINYCISPYTPSSIGSINTCTPMCQSGYIYPNGSCLSTCQSPMVTALHDMFKYCKSPCMDPNMFYFPKESTCKSSCPALSIVTSEDLYNTCYTSDESSSKNGPGTLQILKENTDTALNIGLIIASLASLGDSFSIIDGTVSRMFQYIKYLNISYSEELQTVLSQWSSSLISIKIAPNSPESLKDESIYKTPPYVFSKYNVSPSFLLNVWNDWFLLIISLSVFITFVIVGFIVTRVKPKKSIIDTILQKIKAVSQQFVIILIYTGYGDMVFFSIIEFRATIPGQKISNLSLFVAVVQVLAGLGVIGYNVKLLIAKHKIATRGENQNSKQTLLENFYQKHEGCFVFFKDFNDQSILQQIFLILFIGRNLLLTLILTILFAYPLAQTILIVILNIAMLAFLIIYRPFNERINEIQQLICESALLIVNISTLVMAALDSRGIEAYNDRKNLSYLIIVLNIIFNFAALVFCGITGVIIAKKWYRHIKKPKVNNPLSQSQSISIPPHNLKDQLGMSSLDIDSTTTSKVKPQPLKIEELDYFGKIKYGNNIKNHPENPQELQIGLSPEPTPSLQKRSKSGLNTYTEHPKNIEAINIPKVDFYQTNKKVKQKKHSHIKRESYNQTADESMRGRESERSLMRFGGESIISETERSFSPEIKRTMTLVHQNESNFQTGHLEASPTKIEPNRRVLRHQNTAEAAIPPSNQKSMSNLGDTRQRVPMPPSNQTVFTRQMSVINIESSKKKEYEEPFSLIKPQIIKESFEPSASFASELVKKLTQKQKHAEVQKKTSIEKDIAIEEFIEK